MKLKVLSVITLFICFFSIASTYAQGIGKNIIVLDHVVITGSTNVNDFKLIYNNKHNIPKISSIESFSDSLVYFKIPVEYIATQNKLLLADFRNLIKASEYPFIYIVLNKSQIRSVLTLAELNEIEVEIRIAGKSKMCNIPYFKGELAGTYNYILGKTSLNLSDFDLIPSAKFFGLIKLNNEVFVNFRFNFEIST